MKTREFIEASQNSADKELIFAKATGKRFTQAII
jgi:hypothetical protein